MYKKTLLMPLLAVILSLIAVTPAGAITKNAVPDTEHPYVGLVAFYDANWEFLWRCSGSLLSPSVFLTAGHCADTGDGAVYARVYFQQDAGANYDPALGYDPVTGYPNECATGTLGTLCATSDELYNFGYPAGFPNTHDVGLVILDQAIDMPEYGELAGAGFLDALATQRGRQEITFTASGYGLSRTNPVFTESYRSRLMASSQLVNLRSALTDGFNVQLQGNGKGQGGTCFGDSGGPLFYGGYDSNLIVGVTSFGLNANCTGVDFYYRTDTAEVLAWILETVAKSTASAELDDIVIVEA